MIIVTVVLSGFFYLYNPPTQPISYSYTLTIDVGGSGNYTIYAPIPLTADGEVHEVLSDLHISSGSGLITIVDTEHGKALKLISNGSICVEAKTKDAGNAQLSLFNKTYAFSHKPGNYKHWVYCNYSSGIEAITLKIDSSGSSGKTKIEENLAQGWQEVNARFRLPPV